MYEQTALLEVNSNFSTLPASSTSYAESPANDPDSLFKQASEEGWNCEMDWLWLATQVKLDSQRHYCLIAALKINPESNLAKKGLWMLKSNPSYPLNFSGL